MFAEVSTQLNALDINFRETGENYQELDGHIENAKAAQVEMYDILVKLLKEEGYSAEQAQKDLDALRVSMQDAGKYSNVFEGNAGTSSKVLDDFEKEIKQLSGGTTDWADKTINAANSLFNLAQALTTCKDLAEQFADGTITLTGALTGLASVVMSVVQLAPMFKTLVEGVKSFATTLMTTLSVGTGGAALIIAAIGAAIVGVVALITSFIKESHRAEEELKQAQEKADAAKESFTNAKQAYDSLVSGSQDYTSLLDQLDNLTAGSKAFEDQLVKVNAQAQALIDLLPELKEYVYFDDNRAIRFKEGWEDVVNKQGAKVNLKDIYADVLSNDVQRRQVQQAPELVSVLGEFQKTVLDSSAVRGYSVKKRTQLQEDLQHAFEQDGTFSGSAWNAFRQKYENDIIGLDSLIDNYRIQAAKPAEGLEAYTKSKSYTAGKVISQQDLSGLSEAGRQYIQNVGLVSSNNLEDWEVIAQYAAEADATTRSQQLRNLEAPMREALERYARGEGIEVSGKTLVKDIVGKDFEGYQDILDQLVVDSIGQYTKKRFQETAGYEKALASTGADENLQNIITEAVVGARTGGEGLSVKEIESLKEHSQLILDQVKVSLEESGKTQEAANLDEFYKNLLSMPIEEIKKRQKEEIKTYIHGLSDLFDQMMEGAEYDDLSDEEKQTYDKLVANYGDYLSKIEQMEVDSYERRESTRDWFDLVFSDSMRQLYEAGASNIEILEAAFSDLDRTISSSFDTLEDYYGLMSLVPDDLTISFSELKDLWKQGHAELLENATITSKGQIELDKQVVTNYIEGVKEKYKADLQQRINTLTIQRDILQQELENYKTLSKEDKIRYLSGIESNENLAFALQSLDAVGVGAAEDIELAFKKSSVDGIGSMIEAAQELERTLQGNADPFAWGNLKARLDKEIANPRRTEKYNFLDPSVVDSITAIKAKQEEAFNDLNDKYISFNETRISELASTITLLEQARDNEDIWNEYMANLGETTEDAAKSQEKLLEALKETLERYHEINRELKNLEREYTNLDKLTQRLYGKPHLDNLAQEEKSLEDQIELQKKKLLVVQANLALDLKRVKEIVPYGEIGSDGEIKNYTQILADAAKAYNDAIQDTNNMSDEDKAKYEETMDAIKQRYDDIKEALDQYEETLDEMHELEDQIIDNKYLLEDKKLESLTYKLQLVLDVKENEDAINEFGKKLAESFGDYLTHGQDSLDFGAELEAANEALLPHLKAQWDELFSMYNEANDYASKAAIEQELASVRDQIYSAMEAMLDYVDVLENALPEAVDAARERFDAMINQISYSKAIYDAVKQLTELQGLTVHTEEGFNRLQDLARKSMEAEILNANMQRQWYENAYSRLMEAEAALEQVEEGDEAYDLLKNARDALLEEYNEAEEAMLESAVSALEQAREIFTTQIEKAKEDFSKALTHGLGLDFMMDRYDRYIDAEERYLDVVNEEYEVNKWYRKLQEQIDKAKSADAIERLKELQKEIDVRRANNTLSQYDLEILNAKYEMTLKQMALEEAQSSATNMRLQRDAQGNWNYVYTADYDSILEAQQGFEDAANDYYNIAKQQVKDVTQEILDTWQECADRIAEIYEDETLTVEEREARIAELREYYADKVKDLEEEKNVAVQDIYAAAAEIAQYYESLYNQSLNNMGTSGDSFANRFGETTDKVGSSSENMADRYGQSVDGMNSDTNDFLNNFGQAAGQMGSDSETLADRFGQSVGNMGDASNEFTQRFATDLQDMLSDMNGFLGGFTGNLGNMTSASSEFERLFDQYLTQASQAANEYQMNIQQVTSRTGTNFDELQRHVQQANDTVNRLNQATGSSYQQLGYTISNVIDSIWNKIPQIQQVTMEFQSQIQSIYGAISAQQQWLTAQSQQVWQPNYLYDTPVDIENPQAPLHQIEESEFDYWPRYAKGGYTGPGHEAMPAVLHGSEYVLNPEDTSKILSAAALMKNLNLDTLLSIMNSLKLSASMTKSGLAGAIVAPSGISNSTTQSIQQQVVINADFPNVSDSDEIKEAFDNLINRAIQYTELKQ